MDSVRVFRYMVNKIEKINLTIKIFPSIDGWFCVFYFATTTQQTFGEVTKR